MKQRFRATKTAAALAAAAVLLIPTAVHADEENNPTFESVAWPTQSTSASAFILRTSGGVLNLIRPIELSCANGQSKSASSVLAKVNSDVELKLSTASCNLKGSTVDSARATVADVVIAGGLMKIKGIDSRCDANQFSDTATVGSTWGSLITDDNYSTNGSGGTVLSNGFVVYVNTKTLTSTRAGTVAITVVIPGTWASPTRTIKIGGCELRR